MRWKRSARDKILSGISLNKRGEENPSKAASAFKWIGIFILIGFMSIGGFWAYGFGSSAQGQAAIESGMELLRAAYDGTIGSIFGTLEEAQARGSGDYFGSRTDSEEEEYGVQLVDMKAFTSSVPAGETFQVQYDLEWHDVKDSIEANFYCQANGTKGDNEEKTVAIGDVVPSDTIILDEGDQVLCKINGEDTADLNEPINVRGWFDFTAETLDVTLPIYIITGELADYLDDTNNDFFDYADLDVSQSDLQTLYKGEPIRVGIGVAGEGANDQPLIVRTGEVLSFSMIGVTIENEWDGELIDIEQFSLYLPDGMELDEGLNDLPSLGCPFNQEGEYRGSYQYELDEDIKEQLFEYYFSKDWAGQDGFQTFQCWLSVEEDIFNGNDWTDEEIVVDMKYTYQTQKESASLTIIGKGESLVVESVIDSTGDDDDTGAKPLS
jgi:hypothetical protein